MGPATVQLICGICCACCLISLFVAYFIWAVCSCPLKLSIPCHMYQFIGGAEPTAAARVQFLTVFTSAAAADSSCGGEFNIWVFCLTVVIIIPILGCITAIIAALAKMPGLQAIPPLINLGMAIWGMVLWGSISDTCWLYFDKSYWDLALLFKVCPGTEANRARPNRSNAPEQLRWASARRRTAAPARGCQSARLSAAAGAPGRSTSCCCRSRSLCSSASSASAPPSSAALSHLAASGATATPRWAGRSPARPTRRCARPRGRATWSRSRTCCARGRGSTGGTRAMGARPCTSRPRGVTRRLRSGW